MPLGWSPLLWEVLSALVYFSHAHGDPYPLRSGDHPDGILVEKYERDQINDNHTFQLFCKSALRGQPLNSPLGPWLISSAAEGLPLLTDAVGSIFIRKAQKIMGGCIRYNELNDFRRQNQSNYKGRYQEDIS